MELSKKINEINNIVYHDNKFSFYEHDNIDKWFPLYVDLEKYINSKTIFPTYFSHVYCELLHDLCKALSMSYIFTLSPVEFNMNNGVFLGEKTKKIKNKHLLIKQSAYLQHIVKTFEDNGYDVFNPKSVHSIFEYDDVEVIEVVRSVLLEFLIKSSSEGISEGLKIFEENTKRTLKLLKKRNKIVKQDKTDLSSEKVETSEKNDELLTIEETATLFKVKRQTVYNWKNNGLIQAYSIQGRIYYKKNELLKAINELK
ncbi:helix-turn-helix domain-containing protein [Tenacibaculum sp. AHE15PA]|uniref:helix-turn-helix domain-containing protein n=1 Tax=unclassified Tenacibaculum TaxID=2635139 RepID=UPI001C4E9C4C|nr:MULTISPECIES: helix-turn-helix domain-containing protein [unclassified Tenacibaculum]QXP72515.1 helix-turn-helix domain-containing protein [Tenacibaculum sp. AHE14PA]QXP76430.1 helix-turn-helix domain-containing protein [Tenacibaculum sp. AHE15PA]